MKAMIFAAGLGTRLRPLTNTRPKALIEVAGKPLLEHVIEKLKQAGFDDITINVHHFADMIIDYVRAHQNFGVNIQFSDERNKLLNTGGGIKKAASLIWKSGETEPVLIHNVDILSNADLRSFYEIHQNDDAALLVSKRETQRYLLFNKENRLVGWTNLATGEIKSPFPDLNPDDCQKFAFSGIHLFSPSLIKEMNQFGDIFSIIDFYLAVCKDYHIFGYPQNDLKLLDVGKLKTLEESGTFLAGLE